MAISSTKFTREFSGLMALFEEGGVPSDSQLETVLENSDFMVDAWSVQVLKNASKEVLCPAEVADPDKILSGFKSRFLLIKVSASAYKILKRGLQIEMARMAPPKPIVRDVEGMRNFSAF